MQPLLGLKPVAVPAEVQGLELLAGLAEQVAFADQDLVGLCRDPGYAENPPQVRRVRRDWPEGHPHNRRLLKIDPSSSDVQAR